MSYLIGCKLSTNNKNKYDAVAVAVVTASVRLDPITRPNQHYHINGEYKNIILLCFKNYAQTPQYITVQKVIIFRYLTV